MDKIYRILGKRGRITIPYALRMLMGFHDESEEYKVWSEDESKEWCLKEPEALYDFIRDECQ